MKNNLQLLPVGSNYIPPLPQHEIPATLPKKMKAWVTYRGGKTVLEQIPLPKMLPDDVLIEPLWISICASDVNKLIELVPGLDKTVFGHEFAGRIVDVGKNIDKTLVGQTVVVEEHYPCLQCEYCRKGEFDKCQDDGFLGWYKSGNPDDWVRNGAFAEYVSVHHSCAKRTEGIEKLHFFPSLAEPFGNTVKMEMMVADKCGTVPDTLMMWGGCGAQGLYMVPYFAKKGVKNFVLIYRGKSAMLYMKNALKNLNANLHYMHSDNIEALKLLKKKLQQNEGFVSLELTGNGAIQETALNFSSPYGKIFYYGLPQKGENVFIPGTDIDIYSFLTGEAGVEQISLNGVTAYRVMGRDNKSWEETIRILKTEKQLREFISESLIIAGTTKDIGSLVDYLIHNGVRYYEKPYGLRPAKFAVVNEKMLL